MIEPEKTFKEELSFLTSELICEHCGEELEHGGILEWGDHFSVCKRDAPNSSISRHKLALLAEKCEREMEENRREHEKRFAPVLKKMTNEEQNELICLQNNGMWDGETVLMGMSAFKRLSEFKEKMMNKYG